MKILTTPRVISLRHSRYGDIGVQPDSDDLEFSVVLVKDGDEGAALSVRQRSRTSRCYWTEFQEQRRIEGAVFPDSDGIPSEVRRDLLPLDTMDGEGIMFFLPTTKWRAERWYEPVAAPHKSSINYKIVGSSMGIVLWQ